MTTAVESVLTVLAGPGDPDVDVVVFPGAGAGPSALAGWRAVLPPAWRLSAVCLPGRGVRFGEPFATDPVAVADEVAAVVSRRCGAPVILAGHSLGALWAHETAVRVRPAMLVSAGCEPASPGEPITILDATEQDDRAFIRQLLFALGVTDEETLEELTDISVPILRADIDLARGWRAPTTPLDCPIVSYYGTHDPTPARSWSAHTVATADVVTVPGDHYFFQNSAAEVLADMASRVL
jgi:surfactin synthase thioesterase subunit